MFPFTSYVLLSAPLPQIGSTVSEYYERILTPLLCVIIGGSLSVELAYLLGVKWRPSI